MHANWQTCSLSDPRAVPVMWLWECRWDLCFSDCNNRDQMGTCGQNSKPRAERSAACFWPILMLLLFIRGLVLWRFCLSLRGNVVSAARAKDVWQSSYKNDTRSRCTVSNLQTRGSKKDQHNFKSYLIRRAGNHEQSQHVSWSGNKLNLNNVHGCFLILEGDEIWKKKKKKKNAVLRTSPLL